MKLQPIYELLSKIKTELKAWNVTVELNTDFYDEDDVEVEEINFKIIIFCEHLPEPIQLSIPIEDIDDYDLTTSLKMLQFEIDSFAEVNNLYYHNVSLRLH